MRVAEIHRLSLRGSDGSYMVKIQHVNVVMAFTGCLQLGRVACREYKVRTGSYSNIAQESTESNPHEDGTHSNSKDSSAASA
ncbi:hypothetical protein cyc_05181 [Cyclospora cayetanensis]|uniref:Uncharacterized protein n=1 Tax=Cyclospora cayetanensis TaxID=88456 RepID=A0A1D3CVT5_9EIME|nr:hypothetical protein cyc_05181 [Cyclospora cayetanensis]